MTTDQDFERRVQELSAQWGKPFVRRSKADIEKATGGLIHWRTLANRDSKGTGPQGKVNFGRNVGYETKQFFRWFLGQVRF